MSLRSTGWPRAVLVDTSAFYALLDPDDQWHSLAQRGIQGLTRDRRPLVTSNLVVAETYRLTMQRLSKPLADEWLRALTHVTLVFQTEEDHVHTIALLASAHGRRLTYTDAAALVTMERVGIHTAFSFDRDFEYRGFTRFPELDA